MMDEETVEVDTIQVWSRVVGTELIRPIAKKVGARSTTTPPQLPTLVEDVEFTPLVDPLSQRELTEDEEP